MSINKKSLILLGLLSLVWGGYFLLIEIADDSFPPFVIATTRLAMGAVILLVVLKRQGLRLPPLGRSWVPFLIIGFFEALLPTLLLSMGEDHISPALASVLFSTMPIFTVIIGYIWLSRPLTRNKIVGVVIGFIGTLIVLIPDLSLGVGEGIVLLGALAVLIASLAKSVAALYSHQVLENKEPVVVATTMMSSAAVAGLPFMLILENPFQIRPTSEALLALALIGVSSAVGFLMFFWLIKHRGPTFASIVRFNEPPIAILLSVFFLSDSLNITTLVGVITILLCIAIMNGYLDNFWAKIMPRRTAVSDA
ncbi:MAG: EamA family transporter [Candidatus Promineifilaceae bacterium]